MGYYGDILDGVLAFRIACLITENTKESMDLEGKVMIQFEVSLILVFHFPHNFHCT